MSESDPPPPDGILGEVTIGPIIHFHTYASRPKSDLDPTTPRSPLERTPVFLTIGREPHVSKVMLGVAHPAQGETGKGIRQRSDQVPPTTQYPDEGNVTETEVFGLGLDRNLFLVHRNGIKGVVAFQGKNVSWKLFGVFLANHWRFLPTKDLINMWDVIGFDKNPLRSTVTDAISELRGLLKSLGVGIKTIKNEGYRLIDLHETEAK